ncbi:o-succinylbenzoate synthase [gut metagenome]|uniref:O-succinylbenzoate synthase n=1 Tax=gut metagenome TaxID=749906 RepID=J9GBT6_9ZZZZ
MVYNVDILPKELHFKKPARTSRGEYVTRRIWLVRIISPDSDCLGIGECAPLPDLSCDAVPNYEFVLRKACQKLAESGVVDWELVTPYPSILFGLETALFHLQANSLRFWNTSFGLGREGIPINGLIWMDSYENMYHSIEQKLEAGFTCIKLKIGAIDFEKELALLAHIRQRFSADQITLRVDANGAFRPEDALEKLQRLAAFDIHSIEQPIRAGQWQEMAKLCAVSPIPIALDEELIGIHYTADKMKLLDTIRPAYVVLKPSLHGGFRGSSEWIDLARERGIGYWITSALESNVGLNAIAQWCATLEMEIPQGLGTGQLFVDNIVEPLQIKGGKLWFTNPFAQLAI